jgi:hypothetical protein
MAPLAALGVTAYLVGDFASNYLYDYADRLNAGQTDAQAIRGSLIGNTPVVGGLYRGISNTDPGTGASLNLSSFERGNQFGSGLGEAALVAGGPQLYRLGNATASATSEVVSSLRARAEYYGSEAASVPAAASASSNVGLSAERVAADAAKARSYPYRPDTASTHAMERMVTRGVSWDSVQEAVRDGVRTLNPQTGVATYKLPASLSSTGRGVNVVRNDITGNIITVIDKGSR